MSFVIPVALQIHFFSKNKNIAGYMQKPNRTLLIIIDFKDLREFDSVFVLGILNSIRKEVDFLEGDLRICSLNPELLNYFQQNRLDKIFYIYKNKENAEKSVWRQDDGNLQFV